VRLPTRPRAAPLTRGRLAAAALTGVLLLVAGVQLLPSSATDVGSVPSPSVVAGLPAAQSEPATPAPTRSAVRPFAPVRVQVPGAGIDARVQPVAVGRDGMLGVPDDVRQVGWWRGGAGAAAGAGTVVLVGHVDSARQGPGAFFPLRRLDPGGRVVVRGAGGETAVYVVTARRQYPKSSLPRTEVFGQGTTPRLVLLTCGGRFDPATRHYEDNVVVYATPLRRGA
jgi:hypothetical protein